MVGSSRPPPHLCAFELRAYGAYSRQSGTRLWLACRPSLEELHLDRCANITATASLDHVPALRWLGNTDVALSAAAVAQCRARGCVCPFETTLRRHTTSVLSLTLLPGGLLTTGSGDAGGTVRVPVWDPTRALMVLDGHGGEVRKPAVGLSAQLVAAAVRGLCGVVCVDAGRLCHRVPCTQLPTGGRLRHNLLLVCSASSTLPLLTPCLIGSAGRQARSRMLLHLVDTSSLRVCAASSVRVDAGAVTVPWCDLMRVTDVELLRAFTFDG